MRRHLLNQLVDGTSLVFAIRIRLNGASGKKRIYGPTDFQTCKMRMVLQIFLAHITGKMRMRMQYYNLKKHVRFIEIFIVGITLHAMLLGPSFNLVHPTIWP